MRYFLNTSAAKPIVVGGMTFAFEPVGLRGGSWLGILAVADDAAASVLADGRPPNTEEIPFETYDRIKKKETSGQTEITSLPNTPKVIPNPALAVANRAGRLTEPTTANPVPSPDSCLTPVTLLTTRVNPPLDALLSTGSAMKRPR